MLHTMMEPPSAALRPFIWSYGMTTGRVDGVPLAVPLPARPKQLLTFFFGDRYTVVRTGQSRGDTAPRVTVAGPQTHARAVLSVLGRIDNFTIHFQPSGFNQLFGVPMTELTDAALDARAVIGREIRTTRLPGMRQVFCRVASRLRKNESSPRAVLVTGILIAVRRQVCLNGGSLFVRRTQN
jgi:hypothetical protein